MPPEHIIWLCCGFLAGLITDRKLYHPPPVLVTCYSVEHEVVADDVNPWSYKWLFWIYLVPAPILLWCARVVIAPYYVYFCAGWRRALPGCRQSPFPRAKLLQTVSLVQTVSSGMIISTYCE